MTTANIIDGKAFSEKLVTRVGEQASLLAEKIGRPPALAVVLVGEDPASAVYVRNKIERTTTAGMRSIEHRLADTTSQADLLDLIDTLNDDDSVDGILVQLPLPPQINEEAVINAITPDKDVDGFHVVNAGRLATGQDALVPCTPFGCLLLLRDCLGSLSGLNAVVVGRSNIVGKPMASLLLASNCSVTITHSKTKNLREHCKKADILISAVGIPEMVDDTYVKQDAIIIDVGINRLQFVNSETKANETKLVGDVNFKKVIDIAKKITPVPGGVGPMTIACLMHNTIKAAYENKKENFANFLGENF